MILPGLALASASSSGNGFVGKLRIDDEEAGAARHGRDRNEVAHDIETEIVIERRIPGVGRCREQQRIAVWHSARDLLRCEIAAGARQVLDDELLAEMVRQKAADQARMSLMPPGGKPEMMRTGRLDRLAPKRRGRQRPQRRWQHAGIGDGEVSWSAPEDSGRLWSACRLRDQQSTRIISLPDNAGRSSSRRATVRS